MAKLVAKYRGLPKQLLGQIADKLDKSVTTEDEIEGKLTELEESILPISELALQLQKDGDRRVAEAKKKWDAEHPKPPANTDDEDEDEDADEPAPAKPAKPAKPKQKKDSETLTLLREMANEIKALKTDKVRSSMQSKLAEKLKGVPEKFYSKRALPEKDDDLEAFIEEVQADYDEFEQAMTEKGLSIIKPPISGDTKTTQKGVVSPEIKKYVENKAASEARINGGTTIIKK